MKLEQCLYYLIFSLVKSGNLEALDAFMDSMSLFLSQDKFEEILDNSLDTLAQESNKDLDMLTNRIDGVIESNARYKKLQFSEIDLSHLLLDSGFLPGIDFNIPQREKVQITEPALNFLNENNYIINLDQLEVIK